MSMFDPVPSEAAEHKIPPRTTPTWDMELLVSGATVFGLMQLPAPLQQFIVTAIDQNDSAVAENFRLFGLYSQVSLVLLIATFCIHLMLRGYWVALVGLKTVMPGGIDWRRSSGAGPIYADESHRLGTSIDESIEIADNRATKTFGIGLAIALPMFVFSLFFAALICLLSFLQMLNVSDAVVGKVSTGIVGLIIAPFFLLLGIDSLMGKFLIKHRLDGWMRKGFGYYRKIGLGAGTNPLFAMVSTYLGARKAAGLMVGLMMPVSIFIAVSMVSNGGKVDNGAYDGLPDESIGAKHVMRVEHYLSLRPKDSTLDLPMIASPVIKGDYLQVFVPYWPRSHNAMLKRRCPDALNSKASENGDGLKCLLNMLELKLNNEPIAAEILAGGSPLNNHRGVWLTMPVTNLKEGRHEISLRAASRRAQDEDQSNRRHRIVFWR